MFATASFSHPVPSFSRPRGTERVPGHCGSSAVPRRSPDTHSGTVPLPPPSPGPCHHDPITYLHLTSHALGAGQEVPAAGVVVIFVVFILVFIAIVLGISVVVVIGIITTMILVIKIILTTPSSSSS